MDHPAVVINGAFRGQSVTGQQRYATEISSRLVTRPGFVESSILSGCIKPLPNTAAKALAWAGVQLLPMRYRGSVLLSLTSRAPALVQKSVYVTHDMFPVTNPEWYTREYVALHSRMLKHQIENASALVAVSPVVAEQIADFSARNLEDIIVAPNAPSAVFVDRSPIQNGQQVIRRKFGIDPNNRIVLAVGSIEPRKNLVRLVEAVEILNKSSAEKISLLIVGGGAPVFAQVPTLSSSHVVLAGRVSDETLALLYHDSDVVVFPSLAEGFGLPNVEALAARGNLAVSDLPVFRWVCTDNATYFDPLNTDSIVTGIAQALRVPRRLSEQDRGALLARFSWEESAAAVAQVCSKVAMD